MWLGGSARQRRKLFGTLLFCLPALTACRSPYVNAAVENHTGGPVSPLEVDYPSASFGTELLASGGVFRYRFKILGSGGTKVSWTDAQHREHTGTGPGLREGEEGSLRIELTPAGASWSTDLHP